jgi:hypothetical protein
MAIDRDSNFEPAFKSLGLGFSLFHSSLIWSAQGNNDLIAEALFNWDNRKPRKYRQPAAPGEESVSHQCLPDPSKVMPLRYGNLISKDNREQNIGVRRIITLQ